MKMLSLQNVVYVILPRLALFILLIVGWHVSQNFVQEYHIQNASQKMAVYDGLFAATNQLNHYLSLHRSITSILLMTSSLLIDCLMVFLLVYSLFSKTARWFLGLALIIILRQISQCLVSLPIPEDLIWYDPGFPSLFVTYQVSTDFFFSGHTAFSIYLALVLRKIFNASLLVNLLMMLIIIFQISTVILLHAHYYMDIYAGIFTSGLIYLLILRIQLPNWLEVKAAKNG